MDQQRTYPLEHCLGDTLWIVEEGLVSAVYLHLYYNSQ